MVVDETRFLKAEKGTETIPRNLQPFGAVNGGTNLPALQLGVSASPILPVTPTIVERVIAMTE